MFKNLIISIWLMIFFLIIVTVSINVNATILIHNGTVTNVTTDANAPCWSPGVGETIKVAAFPSSTNKSINFTGDGDANSLYSCTGIWGNNMNFSINMSWYIPTASTGQIVSQIRLTPTTSIWFRYDVGTNKFRYFDTGHKDIVAASRDTWYSVNIKVNSTSDWYVFISGTTYGPYSSYADGSSTQFIRAVYDGKAFINDIMVYNDSVPNVLIDTTAPTYINNISNNTNPSYLSWVQISSNWTDETALAFTWSGNNFTGIWINETAVSRSGLTGVNHTNSTQFTAGEGKTGCYYLYANDTSNNLNQTTLSCITSVSKAPTYSGNSSNVTILNTNDYINIYTLWADELLNFTWSGNNFTGVWINETPIARAGLTSINHTNITQVTVGSSKTVCYYLYANDTASNLNQTTLSCITTRDTILPTYTDNATNDTDLRNSDSVKFNVTLTDEIALSHAIFSYDNGTGIFVNQTPIIIQGSPLSAVVNFTVNITASSLMNVRTYWFVNDTTNNWNQTTIMSLTVNNSIPVIQTLTPGNGYSDRTNLSILINVTDLDVTQNLTVYLYINNTLNQTVNISRSVLTNITATFMSLDGNYSWSVNVSDNQTNVSIQTRYFILDTSNPILTRSFINKTISPRLNNLTLNENCQDSNLFSYEINITNASGYVVNISQIINTTLTSINFVESINLSNLPNGAYNVRHQCSDDHTLKSINDYNIDIQKDISTIKFATAENGNQISVKLKSIKANSDNLVVALNSTNITTQKITDRYIFGFNLSSILPLNGTIYEYTFKVTDSYVLYYRNNSIFPGHFVTGKNWIDFNLVNKEANYSIKQTADKKYEITVLTNETNLNFNSVGGLNIVEQNSTLIIDGTTPLISYIGTTQVNNTVVNVPWILINISVTEINLKNITYFLYYATNKTIKNESSFLSAVTLVNFSGLEDSQYIYNVSIYDNASNYNYTETRNITIDTILPTVSSLSPADGFDSTSAIVSLSYLGTDINLRNCTLFWNGVAINTTLLTTGVTFSYSYESNQISGTSKWYASCADSYGNSNYSQNRTISFNIPAGSSSSSSGGSSSGSSSAPNPVPTSLNTVTLSNCNIKIRPSVIEFEKTRQTQLIQIFSYEQGQPINFNFNPVALTNKTDAKKYLVLSSKNISVPYTGEFNLTVNLLDDNIPANDLGIEIVSACGTRIIPVTSKIYGVNAEESKISQFLKKQVVTNFILPYSGGTISLNNLAIISIATLIIVGILLAIEVTFGIFILGFIIVEAVLIFILYQL